MSENPEDGVRKGPHFMFWVGLGLLLGCMVLGTLVAVILIIIKNTAAPPIPPAEQILQM